ncbi:MAG: type II toxin-antitoxin system VapC family toxin [Alphaproteobacteria bacterium]
MKYLLDTNAVIAILNNNATFIKNMRVHEPNDMAVSSITMYELYFGAYKSQRTERNLRLINKLPFTTLELQEQDGKAAGLIRADLEKKGTPIGPYDILIAGQAVAKSLTLITNNTKEFQRVSDLKIEDWQ